jgi:hypothetical protein
MDANEVGVCGGGACEAPGDPQPVFHTSTLT